MTRKNKLLNILNKHGITGLSIQKKTSRTMSANNVSRRNFSQFCKSNGFTPVGHKNAFDLNGEVYGFSTVSGDQPECRQFGEHYKGLVCNFENGQTKWYSREQLIIGSVTRVGPDGTRYYNVTGVK